MWSRPHVRGNDSQEIGHPEAWGKAEGKCATSPSYPMIREISRSGHLEDDEVEEGEEDEELADEGAAPVGLLQEHQEGGLGGGGDLRGDKGGARFSVRQRGTDTAVFLGTRLREHETADCTKLRAPPSPLLCGAGCSYGGGGDLRGARGSGERRGSSRQQEAGA